MSFTTRMILFLMLMILIAGGAPAQQPAPAEGTSGETVTVTGTTTSDPATAARTHEEVRAGFVRLLGQHPPELARILKLDPTLLSNEPFLARYPELGRFIAEHPEVRSNPHFYLREFEVPGQYRRAPFEDAIETLSILFVFVLIAFALAWLVRTVIEQKRWNRLSRSQSEVHNKILDRFANSEELLAYMKTPAGSKFLESAPIPLYTEPPKPGAPLTRVLWSIQIGVIVAAMGLGMLLVSGRFDAETAKGLFAMGAIAFSLGVGFIASAGVSIFLSRRLGLWQLPQSSQLPPAEPFHDPGRVR